MAVQFLGPTAQTGTKLNLRRFWEKHLDAYDVTDKAAFFMEPETAPPALTAGTDVGPGAGTPPGADAMLEDLAGGLDPGGTTNAAAAAGPTAPSNGNSMSGAAAIQQLMAGAGAGRST
jgi:hypothetical protein